jgi:hypothetical protein
MLCVRHNSLFERLCTQVPTTHFVNDIVGGDMDGDGFDDIVTCGAANNRSSVVFADDIITTGHFTADSDLDIADGDHDSMFVHTVYGRGNWPFRGSARSKSGIRLSNNQVSCDNRTKSMTRKTGRVFARPIGSTPIANKVLKLTQLAGDLLPPRKRTWSKWVFLLTATFLLTFLNSESLAESPVTFELVASFDYPGAVSTHATAINDRGNVAGWCEVRRLVVRGFVRFREGRFTEPITDPDSSDGTTYLNGLNNTGVGSGYYESDTGGDGFLYSGSTFTNLNLGSGADVEKINDAANYCGTIFPTGGFVSIDGTLTSIVIPGAATGAEGINNLNQVVGSYTIGDVTYGYRRDADGALDYPIAVPGVFFTGLRGINDQGWIVGNVSGQTGTHGVLFQSPDRYVLYDYPDAGLTTFTGINNHGLICGTYTDARGVFHSFIVRASSAR